MKGSHHARVPIQSECNVPFTIPGLAVVFKVENKEKSKKRSEQLKRRKLEDAEQASAVAAATTERPSNQAAGPRTARVAEGGEAAAPETGVAPMETEQPVNVQEPLEPGSMAGGT
jgi:hypothetical protein